MSCTKMSLDNLRLWAELADDDNVMYAAKVLENDTKRARIMLEKLYADRQKEATKREKEANKKEKEKRVKAEQKEQANAREKREWLQSLEVVLMAADIWAKDREASRAKTRESLHNA